MDLCSRTACILTSIQFTGVHCRRHSGGTGRARSDAKGRMCLDLAPYLDFCCVLTHSSHSQHGCRGRPEGNNDMPTAASYLGRVPACRHTSFHGSSLVTSHPWVHAPKICTRMMILSSVVLISTMPHNAIASKKRLMPSQHNCTHLCMSAIRGARTQTGHL